MSFSVPSWGRQADQSMGRMIRAESSRALAPRFRPFRTGLLALAEVSLPTRWRVRQVGAQRGNFVGKCALKLCGGRVLLNVRVTLEGSLGVSLR